MTGLNHRPQLRLFRKAFRLTPNYLLKRTATQAASNGALRQALARAFRLRMVVEAPPVLLNRWLPFSLMGTNERKSCPKLFGAYRVMDIDGSREGMKPFLPIVGRPSTLSRFRNLFTAAVPQKANSKPLFESLEKRELYSVVTQQVGADIPMRLPFQNGVQETVTNGYGNVGDTDHHGFAVDFGLSNGTSVVAPFNGQIVDVGDYGVNSTTGAGLTSRQQLGRFVTIRGQGTTATWNVTLAHLSSVSVAVNSYVSAGQEIGRSGNTGWAYGANGGYHLHEQVYNGNGTPARPVYAYGIDTSIGTSSRLITDFVQGHSYRAVDVGPSNDFFSRATTISGASVSLSGSNAGATAEPGEVAAVGNGGASVWYTWTAPYAGTYTIDTSGSNFDTTLGVYQGSMSAKTASDDDSGGNMTSKITLSGVAANQTYRIAVDGYGGATGNFNLHIAGYSPAPSNPTAPTGLTYSRVTSGQITMSWVNNWSGATSLNAQYWTGSSWATFWSGSPTTNRLTVNAGAGSSFYLRIVASGSQGQYGSDYIYASF